MTRSSVVKVEGMPTWVNSFKGDSQPPLLTSRLCIWSDSIVEKYSLSINEVFQSWEFLVGNYKATKLAASWSLASEIVEFTYLLGAFFTDKLKPLWGRTFLKYGLKYVDILILCFTHRLLSFLPEVFCSCAWTGHLHLNTSELWGKRDQVDGEKSRCIDLAETLSLFDSCFLYSIGFCWGCDTGRKILVLSASLTKGERKKCQLKI